MTRKRRGIFIAKEGQTIDQNDNRYESDRAHLQASLIKDPVHMDILTNAAGTALVTVGTAEQIENVIPPIKHNLPYTPEVLVYFYSVSYGGDPNHANAGKYAANMFFMGSGPFEDAIYAEADDTYVYLKHSVQDNIGSGYVSIANQYIMRIKYYILSNNSHVSSHNTRGF